MDIVDAATTQSSPVSSSRNFGATKNTSPTTARESAVTLTARVNISGWYPFKRCGAVLIQSVDKNMVNRHENCGPVTNSVDTSGVGSAFTN